MGVSLLTQALEQKDGGKWMRKDWRRWSTCLWRWGQAPTMVTAHFSTTRAILHAVEGGGGVLRGLWKRKGKEGGNRGFWVEIDWGRGYFVIFSPRKVHFFAPCSPLFFLSFFPNRMVLFWLVDTWKQQLNFFYLYFFGNLMIYFGESYLFYLSWLI